MKFNVKESKDTYKSIIDENGDEISTVWSAYSGDVEATARLFAAAPDMLEVLEMCDEAMSYMSEYDIPLCLPDRIKAAIAKAKGEL